MTLSFRTSKPNERPAKSLARKKQPLAKALPRPIAEALHAHHKERFRTQAKRKLENTTKGTEAKIEKGKFIANFSTKDYTGYVYLSGRSIFRCFYYAKKNNHMKMTAEAACSGSRWNWYMLHGKRTPFFNPEHFLSQLVGAVIHATEQEMENKKSNDDGTTSERFHQDHSKEANGIWENPFAVGSHHNDSESFGGGRDEEISITLAHQAEGGEYAHHHHSMSHTGEEGPLNHNAIGAAGRIGFANFLGVYEIEVHTHHTHGQGTYSHETYSHSAHQHEGGEADHEDESSHHSSGHFGHHSDHHSHHHAHQQVHHWSYHFDDHLAHSEHSDHSHESEHSEHGVSHHHYHNPIGAAAIVGGPDFRGLFEVHANTHHPHHDWYFGGVHTIHRSHESSGHSSHHEQMHLGESAHFEIIIGNAQDEGIEHRQPHTHSGSVNSLRGHSQDRTHFGSNTHNPLAEGLSSHEVYGIVHAETAIFEQARKQIRIPKVTSAAASVPD
ncbi:hypothetical protein HY988_00215 [Candidatus Micrarchaeota archaeon]|nr:hypothetical protein [Candidatus Micrarchaeota archaeon]